MGLILVFPPLQGYMYATPAAGELGRAQNTFGYQGVHVQISVPPEAVGAGDDAFVSVRALDEYELYVCMGGRGEEFELASPVCVPYSNPFFWEMYRVGFYIWFVFQVESSISRFRLCPKRPGTRFRRRDTISNGT